jgi:hypothetical protein
MSFSQVYPDFPSRTYRLDEGGYPVDKATRTVAILGFGARTEVLVTSGAGDETEGAPENFNPNNLPNGCCFALASYPVDPNTFQLFRGLTGNQSLMPSSEYLLDNTNGYLVLHHPVRRGERITTTYVSLSDVNHPRFYLAEQIDDLYTVYGQPGGTNTISTGAQLAVDNGATRLVVIQGDHTGRDPYWFQAYEAISTIDAYFIVPMHGSYYRNIVTAGLASVQQDSATANRRERLILVGEVQRTDISDPNYFDRSVVTDFNLEERILFLAGDEITTIIQGETQVAEGGYLAAAAAGLWSSYDYIPEPLTRKTFARLSQNWPIPDRYTRQQVEQFAKDGLTLIMPLGGVSSIYQGAMTLTNGNPVDEEPSIWRIRDYVAMTMRTALENRFVGGVILANTPKEVQKVVITTLQGLISQRIITAFANVVVYPDPLEPRQIDVGFDVAPVFPLNKIMMTIRVVSYL